VLEVPSQVALAIAQRIDATLTPEQQKRLVSTHPVNAEVYEAYLRGTFYLNQGTEESIRVGLEYLRKAVETDPADPLAYAGLALGYSLSASHGPWAPAEAFTMAKGAARQALRLDETLAEAHAAVAQIALYQDRDWPAAEQAFRRALELNPSLAAARAHYAMYLSLFERRDEAVVEIERAHQADPLNPSYATWIGDIHWGARNYDKAIEAFEKSLEVNHDFPWALRMLGFAYDAKGMYQQAIAVHERAATLDPGMKADLAYTYALAGRRDEALKIAAEVENGDSRGREVDLARIHTALGNTNEAFRWLRDENGEARTPWIKSPWFAPLADDPRFQELLRRLIVPPRQ
jgi:tetratricopeptide (TPR) repeat protein